MTALNADLGTTAACERCGEEGTIVALTGAHWKHPTGRELVRLTAPNVLGHPKCLGLTEPTMSENTLHVLPAEHPHEEAYVVGTPEALRRLRDALDRALASGRPEFAFTFAADGEGYAIVVMASTDAEMAEAVHPYASVNASEGTWPRLEDEDWRRMVAERRRGTAT